MAELAVMAKSISSWEKSREFRNYDFSNIFDFVDAETILSSIEKLFGTRTAHSGCEGIIVRTYGRIYYK